MPRAPVTAASATAFTECRVTSAHRIGLVERHAKDRPFRVLNRPRRPRMSHRPGSKATRYVLEHAVAVAIACEMLRSPACEKAIEVGARERIQRTPLRFDLSHGARV